jgi:hypothetical protein
VNILQYLQKKYQKGTPTTISKAEADAFAIPYPLQAGWLSKHGHREITDFMRERVAKAVSKKLSRRKKKGKPHSAYHQRGLDILHGEVTVAKFAPSPARTAVPPKQYKGPHIDPNSDEFLTSYQWRTVRFDALALYGNSCMCCGATPARGNGVVINVDHIKPRKTHPHLALDINNLQVLCSVCNHGKSNRHETDFRPLEAESDGLEDYSMEAIGSLLRKLS